MFRSLWRLRPAVGRYRWRLLFGILAFLLARVLEAQIPLFLKDGIDSIAAGQLELLAPVLGIALVVLARYAVVTWARMAVRRVGLKVAFDLRQDLFRSLQTQGAGFFNRYGIGDMMTRAVADIGLIRRLISMGTILLVILVFATLVGFGYMASLSLELTLLILPPLPIVFAYAWWSSKRMGVASRAVQDRLSDLSAQTQENLSGIRTVQAMVQEEHEIQRFADTNQAYADAFYSQVRINSLMMAWMPTLAATSAVLIIGYGGSLVLDGTITVGTFAAFFYYVNMVVQPFRVAGMIVTLFQRAAVASDRLYDVLDQPPEIPDLASGDSPALIQGNLRLVNLRYTYPGTRSPVLDGINLDLAAGDTLAIMGRVGSGKSTLLKLLVRLLDPPPGTVQLDGRDLHTWPLAQLRAQVALVPQDSFLFAQSIAANITYDQPGRGLEDIWAAADAADLATTINSFPQQLQTMLGERGVTLSGGQKQRATLARGLVRDAAVLLLDDCFASVDTETEERILRQLTAIRRGRTTLMVSHRVSTARHAGRIIVLAEGQVLEQGSHAELLAAGGWYADLERIQREGQA